SRVGARLLARGALIWTLGGGDGGIPWAVCPPQPAPSRAGLLDRLDPGSGRLLAGSADLRGLVIHEIVELEVAGAAGLRHDVPLDSLDRIGRQAAAGGQHLGESVLCDRAALARGAAQQRGGRRPRR